MIVSKVFIDIPTQWNLLAKGSFPATFSGIVFSGRAYLIGISYLTLPIGTCYSFEKKIIEFVRVPRLRASPRHGGAGRCLKFFGFDPPRGRPFLVRRRSSYIDVTGYKIHFMPVLYDFHDCGTIYLHGGGNPFSKSVWRTVRENPNLSRTTN